MDLKRFTAGSFTPVSSARKQPASLGLGNLGGAMGEVSRQISEAQDNDDYHAGLLEYAKGVNELDREFDQDEDLATLPKRRAERVTALSESLYKGKSRRVQERLREAFDRNAETDSAKWQAIVTKKDSAKRVARFQSDIDVYQNQMIQAQGDDRLAAAELLWNDRLESIRPHMSVGEYSRIRDQVADKVKFQRAYNAMDGQGEFDPARFMDLSPDQVGRLAARHEAVKRDTLRKQAEYAADRAKALAPRLEDSLASAMNEGVPMDGTEDMLAELAGLGEQGAAASAQYRAQFSRAATAWNVMDAVKDQPFGAQMAGVQVLRPEPGSEGYRADMELYRRAAEMVTGRAKAFAADPAGFVRPEAERRARAAADSWMTDEDLEPSVIQASLDRQRELGNPDPRVLTVAQAKGFKDQFERADGDGKAALLQGLEGYGEFSRQALREAGLGLGQTFLADMYLDDPILGRKALDVASVKESDIPVDPASAKDIKKDVSKAYHSGPGKLWAQLYNVTGNPQWLNLSKQLQDVTMKMALSGGDAGAAMDALWNERFDILADGDVQIFTPKSVDADEVADRLRAYRRNLPPELAAFRDGIWKNAENDDGFVLVLPHGGRAMTEDGTANSPIRVVTYDDLSGFAALPQAADGETIYGAAIDMGPMVR